jgi:PPOX class probable FMN-dependent enzyme
MSDFDITTAAQLAEVLGEPPDFVRKKVNAAVSDAIAEFIASSPLVFVATSDADGRLDVSPKGDAPGFVEVDDRTTLLVPERLGNKLAFGFRNILETGRIGLIFVVPGQRETLRVNGTATISRDPALLGRLAAKGKPALLCTRVTVEECFFHCGKAMIRSKLWDPTTWDGAVESLLVKEVVTIFGGDDSLTEAIEAEMEKNYRDELY